MFLTICFFYFPVRNFDLSNFNSRIFHCTMSEKNCSKANDNLLENTTICYVDNSFAYSFNAL